jgi:CBS domain-containing protein
MKPASLVSSTAYKGSLNNNNRTYLHYYSKAPFIGGDKMKVTYTIGNIMTPEIVTVDVDETVADAMQLMVAYEIGSVAIIRQEKIVGILTERDVLKCFNQDPQAAGRKIEGVMSHPPIVIDATATIGRAADLMAEKHIRRLLVTSDGSVCGIITERDLMRATIDVFKKLSDAWV